jgi:hypothetical protein
MNEIIVGALVVSAAVYFGAVALLMRGSLRTIWPKLRLPLSKDPPEFDPKSSYATNLTAVTGVLGLIVSAKILPTATSLAPHSHTTYLQSAEAYAYLSLFFLAVLGLSMVFYFSLGRRAGCYLIADWVVFWGALGTVVTLDLSLCELSHFSLLSRAGLGVIVTFALIIVFGSRIRATRDILREMSKPVVPPVQGVVGAPSVLRWSVK